MLHSYHRRWLGAILLCLLILTLSLPQGGARAAGITVRVNEAKPEFPQSISFLISAESTAIIDRVSLIYGVSSDTCLSSQARQDIEFKPTASPYLHWDWDLLRSGNLPPGVEIWWQWELHTSDGDSLTTEIQKITFEDTGYKWKKLQKGQITLYWAEGDQEFGSTLLDLAGSSLERLSTTIGLNPQADIRMSIYPDTTALKKSLVNTPDWMGGVAFPEYNIVLIGIPPGTLSWARDAIPHELAHLLTQMRTFNCLNAYLPSWFNEGLAMYAEGPVSDNERREILTELKADRLPSLINLAEGFPADSRKADLAYTQSHLVVDFMIEKYSAEKLQVLLDQFRDGQRFDVAMQAVYGLNSAAMEQAWRASLGFGTSPEPSFITPTAAAKRTAIPTLALVSPYQGTETPTPTSAPTMTAASAAATQTPASDPAVATLQATAVSGSAATSKGMLPNSAWLIAGGAVLVVLLATTAGAILLFISRKKKSSSP